MVPFAGWLFSRIELQATDFNGFSCCLTRTVEQEQSLDNHSLLPQICYSPSFMGLIRMYHPCCDEV